MRERIQYGQTSGFDGEPHPDADQIAAFVEKALPAHEREAMLAHLALCPDCRMTVALTFKGQELAAQPVEGGGRRAWFRGWRLACLTGAAFAVMAVSALYMRDTVELKNRRSASQQVAVARQPEIPPAAKQSPEADKKLDSLERQQTQTQAARRLRKEQSEAARARQQSLAAMGSGFGGGRRPVETDELREVTAAQAGSPALPRPPMAAPAPSAPAAKVGLASNALTAGGGGDGPDVLKKEEVARAALTLPSALPVVSVATEGREVLAIDAKNALFMSVDAGEHWRSVPVRWTGRAIKVELVSRAAAGPPAGPMEAFANKSMDQYAPTAASALPAPQMPSVPSGQLATLTGNVTDEAGAAVKGATVTVSAVENRSTRTAVTDRDGGYLLDGLAPGTYQVKTQAQGFEPQVTENLAVKSTEANVNNVALKVGAASETVEVSAASARIEKDNATNQHAPRQRAADAKRSATDALARVFKITTDSGEEWTSADGIEWKRR
jgi:hypothetical protein